MGGELHDKVVEVLGREIAGGVHPPGTVLRTEEAEQRFGISRSVAREVMRTLASMRLVFGRKRVGNVVRPRAEWNLFDPVLIRWSAGGPDQAVETSPSCDLGGARGGRCCCRTGQ